MRQRYQLTDRAAKAMPLDGSAADRVLRLLASDVPAASIDELAELLVPRIEPVTVRRTVSRMLVRGWVCKVRADGAR